jgi:hypothetical protein
MSRGRHKKYANMNSVPKTLPNIQTWKIKTEKVLLWNKGQRKVTLILNSYYFNSH